jgi:UDP-glucose 4-epimerase
VKVLITGGSGWIGSATAKLLQERGHEPISYDRRNGFNVLDVNKLDEMVAGVDHVIHLAGMLGTHELLNTPLQAVNVNVIGGMNVINACVHHDVSLTEITMPRVNPSIYAATKACAMDLALAFLDAGQLRANFVCAYNAYGPGQAYGGDHPQKILPTFASHAWAGKALPVWGDGSLWVDLVHVDDVARMLVEAMGQPGDGQVYDAGSSYPQTVVAVARAVNEWTGNDGGIDYLPPRKGERGSSTDADIAQGAGWDRLGGWRPVFDPERFHAAIDSYNPEAAFDTAESPL